MKYYKILSELNKDMNEGSLYEVLCDAKNKNKSLTSPYSKLLLFDYDNDIWLKEFLNNNPSYFINQFDGNINMKLIEYVFILLI